MDPRSTLRVVEDDIELLTGIYTIHFCHLLPWEKDEARLLLKHFRNRYAALTGHRIQQKRAPVFFKYRRVAELIDMA